MRFTELLPCSLKQFSNPMCLLLLSKPSSCIAYVTLLHLASILVLNVHLRLYEVISSGVRRGCEGCTGPGHPVWGASERPKFVCNWMIKEKIRIFGMKN